MHADNEHNPCRLVPWQESWEQIFQEEKRLIEQTLSAADLTNWKICHVGSTSVFGMVSRPIIDILLCPEKTDALDTFIPPLRQIGYTDQTECRKTGYRFLIKENGENPIFHLYLCCEDLQAAMDLILFQSILQNDPGVFLSYTQLKKTLTDMFPEDQEAYCSVKGMYTDGVLHAYRLGERDADKTMAKTADEADGRIKYWICEFEMSEEAADAFEATCARNEMTHDEFMEAVLRNAIHYAETDPEGFKKKMLASQQNADDEIRLVRCYPVYKGETQAQACRRKLREEEEEAGSTGQMPEEDHMDKETDNSRNSDGRNTACQTEKIKEDCTWMTENLS